MLQWRRASQALPVSWLAIANALATIFHEATPAASPDRSTAQLCASGIDGCGMPPRSLRRETGRERCGASEAGRRLASCHQPLVDAQAVVDVRSAAAHCLQSKERFNTAVIHA
ncbi:hypothetical protein MTO96_010372 [Rhipicephalus appendiculatus]